MQDRDLEVALFMVDHESWKPEDFGYPRGDYILYDLMRLYDRHSAAASKARSKSG